MLLHKYYLLHENAYIHLTISAVISKIFSFSKILKSFQEFMGRLAPATQRNSSEKRFLLSFKVHFVCWQLFANFFFFAFFLLFSVQWALKDLPRWFTKSLLFFHLECCLERILCSLQFEIDLSELSVRFSGEFCEAGSLTFRQVLSTVDLSWGWPAFCLYVHSILFRKCDLLSLRCHSKSQH